MIRILGYPLWENWTEVIGTYALGHMAVKVHKLHNHIKHHASQD
jgi:hypothetical protein